ncbi:MAG: tetratricopeptide repeat protein, partial [Thermoanaerobaculia bacterium]
MRSTPRLAITLLALGGLALAAIWAARPRQQAVAVPALDLDGLQPEVARKIDSLRRRLEADPGAAAPWGELAVNLDVHDLRREAVPFYARAAALDPSEVRWLYYGAIVLEDMGSEEALAWFESARELAPDYPPVHVRYAQALLDRGRWPEAAQAFRRAIEAAPQTSHAHLGLAQIALAQGDPESSREHLSRALEAAPDHGEAHGLLAEVYRRLERPQDARRALLRASQSPSDTALPDPLVRQWAAEGASVYWHLMRGHLALERGAFEDAVREIELALAAEPHAREYNNLGLALRRLGRHAEAEA